MSIAHVTIRNPRATVRDHRDQPSGMIAVELMDDDGNIGATLYSTDPWKLAQVLRDARTLLIGAMANGGGK